MIGTPSKQLSMEIGITVEGAALRRCCDISSSRHEFEVMTMLHRMWRYHLLSM